MIPIEQYLHLDRLYWGLSSYIFLLQFAYDHNENIINKLIVPKIWEDDKYLILSYDYYNLFFVYL